MYAEARAAMETAGLLLVELSSEDLPVRHSVEPGHHNPADAEQTGSRVPVGMNSAVQAVNIEETLTSVAVDAYCLAVAASVLTVALGSTFGLDRATPFRRTYLAESRVR